MPFAGIAHRRGKVTSAIPARSKAPASRVALRSRNGAEWEPRPRVEARQRQTGWGVAGHDSRTTRC